MEFFTPEVGLAFAELKQAFNTSPVLYHDYPEYHIRIKTD